MGRRWPDALRDRSLVDLSNQADCHRTPAVLLNRLAERRRSQIVQVNISRNMTDATIFIGVGCK
jgi:hypothetical protein